MGDNEIGKSDEELTEELRFYKKLSLDLLKLLRNFSKKFNLKMCIVCRGSAKSKEYDFYKN